LEGASDGTVLRESAQPDGGTAYCTVPANHSTLPDAKASADLGGKFLQQGRF
jgi:hypothetical protein